MAFAPDLTAISGPVSAAASRFAPPVPERADFTASAYRKWIAARGPATSGNAACFRIQGSTLVIEQAPHGSVDHIHTVHSDPTNDCGARIAGR
jgi:hypothetical protein